MPILFRCTHCGQLMSISRRKAGALVTCPQCVHRTRVPDQQPESEDPADDAAPQTASVVGFQSGELRAHVRDNWQRRPDPWKDADAEEEEFRIVPPELQESSLDMTPMVDVTFLLLIFFMITASFSLQKSLETTPPAPDSEGAAQTIVLEELEDASVVVEIDEKDQLRVDDVPVAGLSELREILAAKIVNENKTEMLIEADPNATHGTVVAVTDAGIDVQMQRIRRASSREGD